MSNWELQCLCELLMSDDPPAVSEGNHNTLVEFADAEAKRHGVEGWIDFYHGFRYDNT